MYKIAIVTTYHGCFPNTINFWIKSVELNPTIDFLLFTDLPVNNPPRNLKIIPKSFEEIVKIAQSNFDFKISCSRPYKYPDYRPAFGEIFADYLKDYDFWGYSEHDMLYGDLRAFFTDQLLNQFDRFLGNGHLSIYRNRYDINMAYKECPHPNYKMVYTNDRNFYFEEYFGTSYYWDKKKHNRFFQKPEAFDDVDWRYGNFKRACNLDKGKGWKNLIYIFEKGKIFRIYENEGKILREETLYAHFQKRSLKIETEVKDQFMIIPNSIIEYDDDINLIKLRHLAKGSFFYKRGLDIRIKRIKDKWFRFTHPNVVDIMRFPPKY
ncbi:DUF6625 family protein [Segatella bryantii]|uniref:DUF6625 family protein n=1 Tax=Segatella bryantii TaxID=77095 RepID=UPI002430FA90|nr:DUF6625 family protein [Segatella bryantii]